MDTKVKGSHREKRSLGQKRREVTVLTVLDAGLDGLEYVLTDGCLVHALQGRPSITSGIRISCSGKIHSDGQVLDMGDEFDQAVTLIVIGNWLMNECN